MPNIRNVNFLKAALRYVDRKIEFISFQVQSSQMSFLITYYEQGTNYESPFVNKRRHDVITDYHW